MDKKIGWNYRIICEIFKTNGPIEYYYGIREVYYDKDGNINGWTDNLVGIGGYDYNDLKLDFELYKEAFNKPILYLKGAEISEEIF